MGSRKEKSFVDNVRDLLAKDYRGVNIAVYAVATTGLAIAIHRIRPVSKFSKARQIPAHFLARQEALTGTYKGVEHSPVRLLIDHRAPIYLPLWHSSKPPLPVKLWGVEIISGNAVNWLECVARDRRVTLRPVAKEEDTLLSTVLLHLPKPKTKDVETLDIGQKLVELGFAKTALPTQIKKKSFEAQAAPALKSAEARAKSYRNGAWSELLPPLPLYVVYWRKASKSAIEVGGILARSSLKLLGVASKGALQGLKSIASRPFRKNKKVETTT